ncbi:MAG: hypothetical protein IKO44_01285 [Ruminococcus sp.]|nr:hypothetical protein [Ruminococcus sp.]
MRMLIKYIPVMIGFALGIFMMLLEHAEIYAIIIVSAIAVAIIIYFIISDIIDSKRSKRLDGGIYSGTRYASEKWRRKQEKYVAKHGFKEPRGSMKSDLLRRTRSMIGLLYLVLGIGVFLAMLYVMYAENEILALVAGVIGGGVLAAYGYYRYSSPKLRKLIAQLETHPKYDVLNEAYMRGRTITRKECGLNLGAGIVTLFSYKSIVPITFNEVKEVRFYVEHRQDPSGNLFYNTEYHYYTHFLAGDERSTKDYYIELGERLSVEAIEQLAKAGLPVNAEMLGLTLPK